MLSFRRVKISIPVKKTEKISAFEPQALKDQNFVVFGMRACDVQGVKVSRQGVSWGSGWILFIRQEENTELSIALACHEPEESCFCKVFGIDAADPEADVAAWIIEGELFWSSHRKGKCSDRNCEGAFGRF